MKLGGIVSLGNEVFEGQADIASRFEDLECVSDDWRSGKWSIDVKVIAHCVFG